MAKSQNSFKIRSCINEFDLLESETFRSLSRAPELLHQIIPKNENLVIIDEVQKLPSLLDEVQLMIDRNKSLRFILTGSSARKLKHGHANLLGGRALFFNLFPLTSAELKYENLNTLIGHGGLPGIVDSPIAWQDLKNYVGIYLREEIQARAIHFFRVKCLLAL